MTTTIGTDTRRICVSCLGSYNEGRLHFKWIDASTDPDELYEEIQELLSRSQLDFGRKAEEWAIHDHEGYPDGLIGEYTSMETIAQIEEAMEQLDGYPEEAVMAYLANDHSRLESLESFTDSYCGEHDSGKDYAESYMIDTGQFSEDQPLGSYVDWEAVWTGEFECGDYWTADAESGGVHVFRAV